MLNTPAFVYDINFLESNALELQRILKTAGSRFLYPLKPCSIRGILEVLVPFIDGFEVSSLFEAKLAKSVASHLPIHYTSPGMKDDELQELVETCTYISCNSLGQLSRVCKYAPSEKIALRINPQLSFTGEDRYDPCHATSKLGVPINELVNILENKPELVNKFEGVTLHSVCEQEGFEPLEKTIDQIYPLLKKYSANWHWISLGGGYLFEKEDEYNILENQIQKLVDLGYDVYMEPGSATVSESGSLVSRVIDIFDSGGKKIAVLDSTVNHLPEAYEYQYEYPVKEAKESGDYSYILAGSSCLAGDIFGNYSFPNSLNLGDAIHLQDCGAYSYVKAHMFNGLNLPSLYFFKDGKFTLIKEFSYDDFYARNC